MKKGNPLWAGCFDRLPPSPFAQVASAQMATPRVAERRRAYPAISRHPLAVLLQRCDREVGDWQSPRALLRLQLSNVQWYTGDLDELAF